ncbi:MAG: hypothetical protein Q8830_03795 [Candidatus Phytoplasma australasiaticum]|nr:hypothetical protein [Candidatus Phytoplasma australasiaticum]
MHSVNVLSSYEFNFGESILPKRVYRDYVVYIYHKNTLTDLLELEMVDFNVIIGMDWLQACYASVDCRTWIVKFQFPDEPILMWKGSSVALKVKFIAYLRARKLMYKACFYHLVQVKSDDVESHTLESVPIVNEFPKVFPDDLPGVPPDREINVLPKTYPISIPPYRMAPTELKE